MTKKVIIFLCVFTVFIFFAPTMKVARRFIRSTIYAGGVVTTANSAKNNNSPKSAKKTRYDTEDDTTEKTTEESEDMSCCGDTTSTGSDPVDDSNDDLSCASKDDVHDDGGDSNTAECVYGTYKCANLHTIYGCNRIGAWVFLQDCGTTSGKICQIAPSCGYDPYGDPIPYCCK